MLSRFRRSTLRVAVVGAGPAGFYCLEALLRREVPLEIDLIERLPTPFGLIRGGVAPDHQKTKQVARSFEALLDRPEVRFWGGIELGRDVELAELRGLYDAVVLATGAPLDRQLGIPGETLPGVYGSAAFVGWYNGHPDWAGLAPQLDGRPAVVVGNGNVALDVARVLLKTPEEMAESDLAETAAQAIAAAPPSRVTVLGRRGPLQARFSLPELRELASLAKGPPRIEGATLPADASALEDEREARKAERLLAVLREHAAATATATEEREDAPFRLHFFARPLEVLGEERVEALRCQPTALDAEGRTQDTGPPFELPCGLVVAAIGYASQPLEGVPFDAGSGCFRGQSARLGPGLYGAGWCLRGPSGVIGSNKHDGEAVAAALLEEVRPAARPGRVGLHGLLTGRRLDWTDRDGWRAIDAAERAAATAPAPRRKFTDLAALRAAGAAALQE